MSNKDDDDYEKEVFFEPVVIHADFSKRNNKDWECVAELIAALTQQLMTGDLDNVSQALFIYKDKEGNISFESSSNCTVESVGMLASATHIACVYHTDDEPVH